VSVDGIETPALLEERALDPADQILDAALLLDGLQRAVLGQGLHHHIAVRLRLRRAAHRSPRALGGVIDRRDDGRSS